MLLPTHILNKLIIDKPQTWVDPSYFTKNNTIDKTFPRQTINTLCHGVREKEISNCRRKMHKHWKVRGVSFILVSKINGSLCFLLATFKSIYFDHISIQFSFFSLFYRNKSAGKIELSGKVKTSFLTHCMRWIFIFWIYKNKKKRRKSVWKVAENKLTFRKRKMRNGLKKNEIFISIEMLKIFRLKDNLDLLIKWDWNWKRFSHKSATQNNHDAQMNIF